MLWYTVLLLVFLPGPVICNSACPEWLNRYEQFHLSTRGQPNAKYLVHQTAPGLAGGLGDRLRGMMFTVRAAIALQRVVLFTWSHPFEVDNFFTPAGLINWSIQGLAYQPGKLLTFIDSPNQQVISGDLTGLTDTFLTFQTNMFMDGACYGCPPLNSTWSDEAACFWRRLFKPRDEIVAMAQKQLASLYGAPNPRYIAIHLRLGGLTGERHVEERGKGPFKNFIAAITCANKLAHNHSFTPSKVPFLMVADNHHLRTFIQAGNLPNIVAPASLPVHMDRAREQSLLEHQHTVVDFVLLGIADCLVTSPSGFSHHAWLFGGAKPCHQSFHACLDRV